MDVYVSDHVGKISSVSLGYKLIQIIIQGGYAKNIMCSHVMMFDWWYVINNGIKINKNLVSYKFWIISRVVRNKHISLKINVIKLH